MRRDFAAGSAAMPEVAKRIGDMRARTGYLLDPHTACGVVALDKATIDPKAPRVVLATAHPAKFPETMEAITGERPSLPAGLETLMTATERVTVVANDLTAVQRFVQRAAEAAKGAS
jgi:threonine synthase